MVLSLKIVWKVLQKIAIFDSFSFKFVTYYKLKKRLRYNNLVSLQTLKGEDFILIITVAKQSVPSEPM